MLNVDVRTLWEGTNDELIVARLKAGEPALFEVLMRRHNQRLFRAARAIVRDDDEAEDVMQEAYVSAFRKLEQFEGRAKFSTWLMRIVVNEALARVRKRRPHDHERHGDHADQADVVVSPMRSPEDDVSNRELGRVLEPLVDALPEEFRCVFVLRAVEGLDVADVAESLGLSEETVRTRFFRARRLLQLQIEQQLMASVPELYQFHLQRCDRIVAAVFARILPS